MGASNVDQKQGVRLLIRLTAVLAVLLAALGILWMWRPRSGTGEWTYGAPLQLPGHGEVTKIEVRPWTQEDWKELPADSATRLLDALASNREYLPPKGIQCAIPVVPDIELRLQSPRGTRLRIAMSWWSSQILATAVESGDGSVPDRYAWGSGGRSYVLDEQARGAAMTEIAAVLPELTGGPKK